MERHGEIFWKAAVKDRPEEEGWISESRNPFVESASILERGRQVD